MLKHPHTRYTELHVYYLDRCDLPPCNDPDLIGIWIEDDNAVLFFHRAKKEVVDALCQQAGAAIIYEACLDYHDWEAGVSIGSFATKFLRIRPVWERSSQGHDDRPEIVLDPSVIFGSGFHPTTRLCLETLEQLIGESGIPVRSMLDLGTGTGLLAIAAATLGVEKVRAFDNNPLAVEVARHNVRLNDCTDQVKITQLDLMASVPDTGVDLVITNLYKGLLERLFTDPSFWQGRMYLVCGFLPGMEADLLAALPDHNIEMMHRAGREQWRLWLLRNRGLSPAAGR